MYIINFLFDPRLDLEQRDVVGKVICSIATLNMTANLTFTVKVGFSDMHDKFVNWMNERSRRIAFEFKINNRRNVLLLQPEKFKDWQPDIDFYDAQVYCKWWSQYRIWLIENKVSLTDFK